MIKLSDVSTERLIAILKSEMNSSKDSLDAYLKLKKYSVKDYQQLKDLIVSRKREFNNDFFRSCVEQIEKNIEHATEIGREPMLFTCNNYEGATVDTKTLKITDRKTLCNVLLCKSPAIPGLGKYGEIRYMQISDVKNLLGKVSGHSKSSVGNNSFVESMRRFNNIDAENIKKAINFYEQQVLRQAMETKKRGVNLFIVNKARKQEFVSSQIKEIVEYLVNNADICVWGELTSAQKIRLISAVTSRKNADNEVIRKRMIDVIADYTTLSELEAGVVKQKTLDRFIVR